MYVITTLSNVLVWNQLRASITAATAASEMRMVGQAADEECAASSAANCSS